MCVDFLFVNTTDTRIHEDTAYLHRVECLLARMLKPRLVLAFSMRPTLVTRRPLPREKPFWLGNHVQHMSDA